MGRQCCPLVDRRLAVGLLLAWSIVVAVPTAAETSARGDDFRADQFYLTTQTGNAGAGSFSGELLQAQVTGPQGTIRYAPVVDQGIGSVPIIGGTVTDQADTQSEATWYWDGAWEEDRILSDSVAIELHLRAQANAVATLDIGLYQILPEGTVELIARHAESLSVGTISGQAYNFDLIAESNPVMNEGASLRLTIRLSGASAVTLLDYDDPATGSRIVSLPHERLDTDGDGLGDSAERALGSNPKDPSDPRDARRDSDGDGLSDRLESDIGTDPFSADTDGDGWNDGVEFRTGSDALDPADMPEDSDSDGLPDIWERDHFGDLNEAAADDPDQDGCHNACEVANGTDPNDPDTDGDGTNDGDEVDQGTDPLLDPVVVETDFGIWEVVGGSVLFVASLALIGVGLFSRHAL